MAACGLLVSAAAMASVPTACNSTFPCGIPVVGQTAGVADGLGQFTITVKDLANNPVANSSVVIDLSACCNDIHLSSTQWGAGVTVDVPTKTVRVIGNASGVATFRIMGGSDANGTSPGGGCAKIYADGVLLTDGICKPASVQVAVYDLNGSLGGGAGVGPADLSVWLADLFATPAPYRARSDYDYSVLCVQDISPADLSKWLAVLFGNGSTGNGPGFIACP
jgi:hypothetical protein